MNIQIVQTSQDKLNFVKFPIKLYENDEHWIRPIDKDVEDVFDSSKNKLHSNGKSERWLLERNGEIIGRIAAFVNFAS